MERQEGKLARKDTFKFHTYTYILTCIYLYSEHITLYIYYKIHIKTKTKKFRTQYTKIVKNSVPDQDVV